MFIIIIGGGRTGKAILQAAAQDHIEAVVIEKELAQAEEISLQFDCTVIHADATASDILETAGVRNAEAVIATTASDAVNLMCLMLAKQSGVKRLVGSVSDEAHVEIFKELGIECVENPHRLNGRYLYRAIRHPGVKDFLTLSDGAEIIETEIGNSSALIGQDLSTIATQKLLPKDTLVVAIVRNNQLVIPKGSTQFIAGDKISILVTQTALPAIIQALRPDQ